VAAIGMTAADDDLFDLKKLVLPDQYVQLRQAAVPRKIQKRRKHFIMVPVHWYERLQDAHGRTTWQLALFLLYQHWKQTGKPIKLPNGMLKYDGINRASKWRALKDLERLGLISIQRRLKRSPIIQLHS
jgi:hypothetical protein